MMTKCLKPLLVTILLLITTGQSFAHPDYTKELFGYQDKLGNEFVVESYWTDGIITSDPGYLRVVDEFGLVVYKKDWVKGIIAVEEPQDRYSVFEFGHGLLEFIPINTIIFENGGYYEGKATAYALTVAIWEYLFPMVAFSMVIVLLFLLAQGPIKSIASFWKCCILLFTAPLFLFMFMFEGSLLHPVLILFIYWAIKFLFWSMKVSVKIQKRIVKIVITLLFLAFFIMSLLEGEFDHKKQDGNLATFVDIIEESVDQDFNYPPCPAPHICSAPF